MEAIAGGGEDAPTTNPRSRNHRRELAATPQHPCVPFMPGLVATARGARSPMTRVGFVLKVKPALIDSYVERHCEVWPEMLEALRAASWHNYSLFLAPDGTLFGYFETPTSLAAAQEAMQRSAVNARWQSEMAPFFELPQGAAPDTAMVVLREIFHLD